MPEPAPEWREPAEVAAAWQLRRRRLRQVPWTSAGVGVVAWGGWALPLPGAVDVALSGWLVVGLTMVLVRQVAVPRSRMRAAARERDFRFDQFRHRVGEWRSRMAARERVLAARAVAKEWLPLRPSVTAARVEVFGGTGDGWASLVTTVGSSLLRAGDSVLVVDLSERRVADDLAGFAGAVGLPVSAVALSRDDGTLLRGLDSDEVAEVVAGAVATRRSGADAADLRVVDASILAAIARSLEGPITFARLAAGLRVVRGHYGAESPLTPLEARRLTAQIDAVGSTDRVVNALHALTNLVELLAAEGPLGEPVAWSGPGLTVLATEGPHPRRKDFLDRVLFERVLHAVRVRPQQAGGNVVFVAGADRIGPAAVEELARQARRCGVRLVLMLEHLRDDVTRLLGGDDSATILMRLGNHEEAKVAAEFIGREHTFKISQITRQVGQSFTEGHSDATGTQSSASHNEGTHRSRPAPARWFDRKAGSESSSAGTATSRSDTWQHTVNYSLADSESTGTTESRVYEFTVEPTQLQDLPPTAFILVEHNGVGRRRIVLADCNPGITLLSRVVGGTRWRDEARSA
ncbi:hypothetical protein BN6_54610 [Saccharothrix espanaensis DSM 44229]|uniref:Uncharacterized protein n=1 Tax=Saccharothrix espanaensis (strain ATCC 51144 / DSM 44229 / JCM 9112 / NBRC 15066 / NRRL 15764) TaxID=1179773 RepID=K0JXR9_SACES|nr:hypothetical protein BN6_54610 [Saccharothrix espanaensis DSM 44229]